ncbi:methyltransferase type 12 [Williamsia sp. Leaf354]|uniref:DinB family protein n=1 Tax=Williamsia sp. Leaf354 TaxID=1736349 RepID=UPI0006F863CA|nr:DinB family protein [Williamsia sp. Leaf354]KQS00906.1 methyltransferase type 12 [Williamsia sp. Leaf354]
MPIVPDTANWTWVLERACPACGLDASRIEFDAVADLTEDNVDRWPRALDVADPALRPDDHTWSPLEYAAHVRDVFRIFGVRLDMMLTQTDPLFDNWDQDATAIAERYGEQDPAVVLAELRDAGLALARDFRAVHPTSRMRTGRRSDGSVFTVETLARYFIHDPVHHLVDVTGERVNRG